MLWHDRVLTLKISATHQTLRAKNTPYQPLWYVKNVVNASVTLLHLGKLSDKYHCCHFSLWSVRFISFHVHTHVFFYKKQRILSRLTVLNFMATPASNYLSYLFRMCKLLIYILFHPQFPLLLLPPTNRSNSRSQLLLTLCRPWIFSRPMNHPWASEVDNSPLVGQVTTWACSLCPSVNTCSAKVNINRDSVSLY